MPCVPSANPDGACKVPVMLASTLMWCESRRWFQPGGVRLAVYRWSLLVFLATTVLTSVTGFFFPFHKLLPSHIIGVISLVLLAFAIAARYALNLAGAWLRVYSSTAVLSLWLNVFVLIAQLFMKVPALHPLAPKTENRRPKTEDRRPKT